MSEQAKTEWSVGQHVHIMTASHLHFRGPILALDEDTITILDHKTRKRVGFSWRTIEVIQAEERGAG